MDITRLQTQLLRTQLNKKDNPLFQLLNQMIVSLKDTSDEVTAIGSGSSGSSSGTTTITNNNLFTNSPIGNNSGGLTGIAPVSYPQRLFTPGSVIFAAANGTLSQNNSKFFWDITNQRLGIGTSSPLSILQVNTDGTIQGVIVQSVDSPTQNIFEIRSLGGGFTFKDATPTIQLGGLIGGGTSALGTTGGLRLFGNGVANPVVISENGEKTYLGGNLYFSGSSASFPMLTRSTTELHCKLADNSAFTTFRAENLFADQGGGGAVNGAIQIGPLSGSPQFGGIWIGQASPSASNYTFLGSSSGTGTTLFNIVAGGILEMRVANNARLIIGAAGISVNEASATAPTIPLLVRNAAKTTSLLSLTDAGRLSILANILNIHNYTVATLPAGTQGDIAYVTDATGPTYLGALVGGGAVKTPVFYNGAAWVSF